MAHPRAVLDANLLISMILAQADPSLAMFRLLEAAANQEFDLVLPEGVLAEFGQTVRSKPYFTRRLSEVQIVAFEQMLRRIGTTFSDAGIEIEPLARDPKDDYLVASTLLANAEFLVTGDNDLLVLKDRLMSPKIVSVAEFFEIINAVNEE